MQLTSSRLATPGADLRGDHAPRLRSVLAADGAQERFQLRLAGPRTAHVAGWRHPPASSAPGAGRHSLPLAGERGLRRGAPPCRAWAAAATAAPARSLRASVRPEPAAGAPGPCPSPAPAPAHRRENCCCARATHAPTAIGSRSRAGCARAGARRASCSSGRRDAAQPAACSLLQHNEGPPLGRLLLQQPRLTRLVATRVGAAASHLEHLALSAPPLSSNLASLKAEALCHTQLLALRGAWRPQRLCRLQEASCRRLLPEWRSGKRHCLSAPPLSSNLASLKPCAIHNSSPCAAARGALRGSAGCRRPPAGGSCRSGGAAGAAQCRTATAAIRWRRHSSRAAAGCGARGDGGGTAGASASAGARGERRARPLATAGGACCASAAALLARALRQLAGAACELAALGARLSVAPAG